MANASSKKQLRLSIAQLPDSTETLTAHGAKTSKTDNRNCDLSPDNEIHHMSLKDDIRKLLSSPTFLLFVLGKVLMFTVYSIATAFMAPFAASEGLSIHEVALVLTVFGATDIVTRPVHGWIVSLPHIDSGIYIGSLVLASSVICGMYNSLYVSLFDHQPLF
jgi:hypothetical protein